MRPTLPPGDYPFILERFPLDDLAMIEAPADIADMITAYAAAVGLTIARGDPVEIQCQTRSYGCATVLVWWPEGDRMHMLVPKHLQKGIA